MTTTVESSPFQIITFYEFKDLTAVGSLEELEGSLNYAMHESGVRGTIVLAAEGFNSTICGTAAAVSAFVTLAENILKTRFVYKTSFHDKLPHRKIDVKVRPEIVTLKKPVNIHLGKGTHVDAAKWNEIISADDTLVLDARNDYEFRNGTFRGAVNPSNSVFSDLPDYVERNLDPSRHKNIAMFCTGGIRCEKLAPYMKGLGFDNVYQLEGGILRYLEQTPAEDSLWEGECFVFDDRRTVDENLQKGTGPDYSLERRDQSREQSNDK